MERDRLLERIRRILALPALIEEEAKQLVALRAERRTIERELARLKAIRRRDALRDPEYASLKNQGDREAWIQALLAEDPEIAKLEKRLDQILTAIDKAQAAKEVLEHERKALKAALEREYALIIEEALNDRKLADVVARRALA